MLKNNSTQAGMSLIESMIALVIISVGLLGIAALQIVALQQSSSSQWHSKAVWYSYEMSDRILVNSVQFANYADIDTSNNYSQDCQNATCTPAQLLVADAEDWSAHVESLPRGQGIITAPSASQLMITVMWDDDGTGASGTNCSEDHNVDLTCYSVTVVQ